VKAETGCALRGLLTLAPVLGALSGCAMDVQVIRYPDAAQPEVVSDCEVELLAWHRAPARSCRDVGDVYVGDPGLALLHCGREPVEAMIRNEACRLGANVALVRRVEDFQSSCYQARARLLQCAPGPE
jgi:hypothetical protein